MQESMLALSPADLAALADQVARRFAPGDGTRAVATEPADAWFTIGDVPQSAEATAGLVWARWPADSPAFRDVWNYRGAVRGTVLTTGGDLWIGFAPPPGLAGDELVDALVERIVEVHELLGVILDAV